MKSLVGLAVICVFVLLITGLLAVGVGYLTAKQKIENSSKSTAAIYDPIASDPKEKLNNLTQSFKQNEIEKRKRYAQFLYINNDDEVVYRWSLAKFDSIRVGEAQFVCFPSNQASSWIDTGRLYQLLENGYRYNENMGLESIGEIETKADRLSKMLLILNEVDNPMLVIFFGCRP